MYVDDWTYQFIGLLDLVWGLFQSALGGVNSPVTVVDVLLHVAHVVKIKAPFGLLRRRCRLILRFQSFAMCFGAGTEVLLGVGEEVVRAGANEVGPADFGVCD